MSEGKRPVVLLAITDWSILVMIVPIFKAVLNINMLKINAKVSRC